MESKTKPFWVSRWYAVYIAIVFIILVFWCYLNCVLHISVVVGDSMVPTYSDGDTLECSVGFSKNDIKRGDVVVVASPEGKLVKRVIALPGEAICIKDGQFYVNKDGGEFVLTEYEFESIEDNGIVPFGESDPLILSDSQFFCVGDNRNYSTDSRVYGPFNFDDVLKIVKCKIF